MKKGLLFWLVVALATLSIAAVIIGIKLSEKTGFVPPEFDEKAKTGFPSVSEDLGFADANINGFEVYVCSNPLSLLHYCGHYICFSTNTFPHSNTFFHKFQYLSQNFS